MERRVSLVLYLILFVTSYVPALVALYPLLLLGHVKGNITIHTTPLPHNNYPIIINCIFSRRLIPLFKRRLHQLRVQVWPPEWLRWLEWWIGLPLPLSLLHGQQWGRGRVTQLSSQVWGTGQLQVDVGGTSWTQHSSAGENRINLGDLASSQDLWMQIISFPAICYVPIVLWLRFIFALLLTMNW